MLYICIVILIILLRKHTSIQTNICRNMQKSLLIHLFHPTIQMHRKNAGSTSNFTHDQLLILFFLLILPLFYLIFQHWQHQEWVITWSVYIVELIRLWQHVVLQETELLRSEDFWVFCSITVHYFMGFLLFLGVF